jgi:hypothetical protein
MMKRVVLFVFVALGLSLGVSSLAAQNHTIEIRDGRVFVDGRAVEVNSESDLSLNGLNAQVRVPANTSLVFEVDGNLYRISSAGVEELDRPLFPTRIYRMSAAPDETGMERRDISREASFIVQQAEELRARAGEMERIGVQLQTARVPDGQLFEMIESLRRSAIEAEQVAQALPHYRTQSYLSEVRSQNVELYERLVREQRLEEESLRLSETIRALPAGTERNARVAELRDRLEQIFQIKQENRQHEIEELEARLNSLQQRLEKRDRYHDYIIERRLNQLIGSENDGQSR